jgi:hypothetical protein
VKQIRKRLTYANVMSSIAVFLVLGGATAFAATKIGANELKANSVLTGKIKKEAVTTSKLKNSSVNTSKLANDAVTGAKVDEATLGQVPSAARAVTADSATTAASANPEAFAKIEGNGTVVASLSKGIGAANVTHPSTGTYCITVPGFQPRGGQATPQFGGSYGITALFTTGPTGFCPSPATQVITASGGTTPAPADETFYVVFYR